MRLTNSLTEYGSISKIFHWISAAVLITQIPLGFYLVDLDFGEKKLTIESIHVEIEGRNLEENLKDIEEIVSLAGLVEEESWRNKGSGRNRLYLRK